MLTQSRWAHHLWTAQSRVCWFNVWPNETIKHKIYSKVLSKSTYFITVRPVAQALALPLQTVANVKNETKSLPPLVSLLSKYLPWLQRDAVCDISCWWVLFYFYFYHCYLSVHEQTRIPQFTLFEMVKSEITKHGRSRYLAWPRLWCSLGQAEMNGEKKRTFRPSGASRFQNVYTERTWSLMTI